jgi:FkbM family methyltransferase
MTSRIEQTLRDRIEANRNRYYLDNLDTLRFPHRPIAQRLRKGLAHVLTHAGLYKNRRTYTAELDLLRPYFSRLDAMCDRLEDGASRALLADLMAYRVLGPYRYRLPLSTPGYRQAVAAVEQYAVPGDTIPVPGPPGRLQRYRLDVDGTPVDLYLTRSGIYNQYVLRQYECRAGGAHLQAGPGQVVIDAGGCFGDSALYFAARVGDGGHVYCLEFIPSNLEILRRNLALNPHLQGRITVIPRPLWDTADQPVYYHDLGPGSMVSFEPDPGGTAASVQTLTIDRLMQDEGIRAVDWIKMDIEGAEGPALRGARSTLHACRPTLAVAIYHSMDDFVGISEWVDELGAGYQQHLGHYTIHREESVLFAMADGQSGIDSTADTAIISAS